MKFEQKILMVSALTFALAGVSQAAKTKDGEEKKPELEKCYGIAKAGHSDCKGGSNDCSGKSEMDGDKSEYLLVPAGLCDRIVGGSLTPDEEKAMPDMMKEGKEMPKDDMMKKGDGMSKDDMKTMKNSMGKDDMKSGDGMAKEGQ